MTCSLNELNNELDRAASVNFHLLPLKPWMDDPEINEICINRPKEVFTERQGRWERFDVPTLSFDHLHSLAIASARFQKNHISETNPLLSATLPNRERIQVVLPPACEHGIISITIRKFTKALLRLDDFERQGFFSKVRPITNELRTDEKELLALKEEENYTQFLRRAVQLGKVIVVVGETGAGKTIFMNGLLQEIPHEQRLITISDVPDLSLPSHPNHVHLLYPSEAKEEENAPVTSSSLLKSCLRMKPNRILLSELRGSETYDFIDAAASGHAGSITSCHAGSAQLAFERLALMILKNPQGRMLPYDVIKRLLYLVVDVVMHIHNEVTADIGRHITEIWYDPMKKRQG